MTATATEDEGPASTRRFTIDDVLIHKGLRGDDWDDIGKFSRPSDRRTRGMI